MTKIYSYRDIYYDGAGDEDVYMTVKFISDGNYGKTTVNIPGEPDPVIVNSNTAYLGKIVDLTSKVSISISDIANPIDHEDTITVEYYLNETLIKRHSNPKSESDTPMVILLINFGQK